MAEATQVHRVILGDSPEAGDEFSGGGHQRTATALARAIRQAKSSDQAIGLEGSWGSGKSTVVKLAQSELENQNGSTHYHVFTYDLWGNYILE